MAYFVLLFIEIAVLFLLSRVISRTLSKFMPINFLFFIFLPGVIVHELSHLFMAVILFVGVGDIEFAPKVSGNGLKLGSIAIAKTDPIRRSLIGFAPVFAGLFIVICIVYFFTSNILSFKDWNPYFFVIVILSIIYILFAIANTMFSSGKDMEGTVEILATLIIIFIIAYIVGFRPQLSFLEKILTKDFFEIIKKSSIFLSVPIAIDIAILGIIKIFKRVEL